jgi:hypothetical protein
LFINIIRTLEINVLLLLILPPLQRMSQFANPTLHQHNF